MTMKSRTIVSLAAAVVLIVGAYIAWDSFRGHAETVHREAKYAISATELLAAFTADERAATEQYVGVSEQVLEVTGSIRAMESISGGKTNVVLETNDPLAAVVCEFDDPDVPQDWRAGAVVKVKGVCTGMLMDVVLVRCAAVK